MPLAAGSGRIQRIIGILLAVAGLAWVLHDVQFGRMVAPMRGIRWGWVGLAIVFDVLSYVCQGARWRYLLRPVGSVSLVQSTQAIYAGLFTNEVVPLRVGELVRAYLVSRWTGAKMLAVVPSIAVERLFDGVWLALAIGVTAIYVPLPRDLLVGGDVLGALVIAGTAWFLYLAYRHRKDGAAEPSTSRHGFLPLRFLATAASHVAHGVGRIGLSPSFYASLFVSPGVLVFQGIAFWLVMVAYGFPHSLWVGLAVFLIVHLGTALPNAPSNIGTYQFFCVVGLRLFGVEKSIATGFSFVVFFLLTIPLWVLGLVAIARSGMSLPTIRAEIDRLLRG
jgi:glycosyltransferase 2 family protein